MQKSFCKSCKGLKLLFIPCLGKQPNSGAIFRILAQHQNSALYFGIVIRVECNVGCNVGIFEWKRSGIFPQSLAEDHPAIYTLDLSRLEERHLRTLYVRRILFAVPQHPQSVPTFFP